MREINTIVIHCADTYPDMDIGVDEIRGWHLARGWNDIGYHWVIRRSGNIERGRDEEIAGAHAKGHNKNSIGICLVGGKGRDGKPACNFTFEQYDALVGLCHSIGLRHNILRIIGHNEVSDKACPCFDVQSLFQER